MLVETLLVGKPNDTEELPGGTVTVRGALMAGEPLVRVTTAPPAGA